MSVFETRAKIGSNNEKVYEVVFDGKPIAACGNSYAAGAIATAFEQRNVTSLESFNSLPAALRNTFKAVTMQSQPQF